MSRFRWSDLFARTARPRGGRRRTRPVVEALEERALLSVAGTLDPTFGNGGIQSTDINGNSGGHAVAIDQSGGPTNGDIYVAGFATDPSTRLTEFAVARYLPTGQLDTSFRNGGEQLTNFGNTPIGLGNAEARAVAVQQDGRIVVGGFAAVNFDPNPNLGANDFAVVRYNPDGSLDSSFGTNGKVVFAFTSLFGNRPSDDFLNALAIDSQDRIVVGGDARDPTSGLLDFALARLDASGTLDTNFGANGNNGRVIDSINSALAIGPASDFISGLAIDASDNVVVTGEALEPGGQRAHFVVARYLSTGGLDPNFDLVGATEPSFGVGSNAGGKAVALGPGGQIVVAGEVAVGGGRVSFGLAEFQSDGTLNPSFGSAGETITAINNLDNARAVAFDRAGNIVVAGFTFDPTVGPSGADVFAVARYTPGGALDPTFDPSGPRPGVVTTSFSGRGDFGAGLAIQPDGNVVVAGSAIQPNNDPSFALARYSDQTSTVQFSADSSTVDEGQTAQAVTITRTGDTSTPVTVTVTTSDGTARAGTDYIPFNQPVTIPAGQSSVTVPIVTLDDNGNGDPAKTVNLTLSNPSGAVLGPATRAPLIILEPELASQVQFGSATFAAGENGGSISIPIVRTGDDTSAAASVTVSVTGGSATPGRDFQIVSPTVQFAAGQTQASLLVTILNDGTFDGSETVNLALTAPSNVGLGSPSTAVLTITETNPPPAPPPAPPAPPPAHRPIVVELVPVKVGKKQKLMVEVLCAETGALEAKFLCPFQHPTFGAIQASAVQGNGAGLPDEVLLTARRGHRSVRATFFV